MHGCQYITVQQFSFKKHYIVQAECTSLVIRNSFLYNNVVLNDNKIC